MAELDNVKRAKLPNSAFAYVDSKGRRRLPINDESHVRNALARFNQTAFEDEAARDRARKRLILTTPFAEGAEHNVRAKITKAVGRPADIYSLGALFYYLVSGAYANPKALYDSFRKFIEYERKDKSDTVRAYIEHEYSIIQNLRTPKNDTERVEVAPEDRFFSYKQYLDGGGELIDKEVMYIIARAMIRNKPDSYCMAWDLDTQGITEMVGDLMALYVRFGVNPTARGAHQRLGFMPLGGDGWWTRLVNWLRGR